MVAVRLLGHLVFPEINFVALPNIVNNDVVFGIGGN
jgi:hypothetical protein